MRVRVYVVATTACSLVACTVPFTSSETVEKRSARDSGVWAEVEPQVVVCGPSLTELPPPPADLASATLTVDAGATWTKVASMKRARRNAFSRVLPDGRVLVIGGTYQASDSSMYAEELTAGVETYDPVSGIWTLESEWPSAEAPVALAAVGATSVVAITATSSDSEARMRIYDADSRTWSLAASPPGTYTGGSSLTRLGDGRLLLAGGRGTEATSWSTHIYDPSANVWRRAASMRERRAYHRAMLLDDGRVVAIGGNDTGNRPVEIYDPVSNTWTATGGAAMQSGSVLWEYGGGWLTADHRVVVPGWQSRASAAGWTQHPFAVLDLDCGRWETAVYLPRPLAWFALVRLPTMEFAMVGGAPEGTYGTNTYATPIYDPVARRFHFLPPLPERRLGVTAVALKNGGILAFGGTADSCGTSCFPPPEPDAWVLTP